MSGYNILIPDLSRNQMPYIVLPVMDTLQALGHTPVTMDMSSINTMYNQMRYERHGCYEIFQFYVRDLVKKGKIDFGFCAGMYVVLEDSNKHESHHLLEECGIPNIIYLHSRDHSVIARLHELRAQDWQHTFFACSSGILAGQLAKSGIARAVHIPPGANFRLFYPQDHPPQDAAFRVNSADQRLNADFDISFTGSYGVKREELLGALVKAGMQVAVFGDEKWRQSELAGQWRNTAHYLQDLNTIFNASRINLDLPHDSTRLDDYLSCRLFDVPAAKGFLLAHRRPGLADIVDLDREIVAFDDAAELVKWARFYLDHEEERLAVARRGHQRIVNECGWNRRLDCLLPQMEMHLLTAAV